MTLITIIMAVLVGVFFILERVRPGLLHTFEESVIALLLATMTLVSFFQVVARYGFSSGWDAALEFTRILFAWLTLFGMSYAVRANTHLGVDAFARMLPGKWFRAIAIFGALVSLLYAIVLLYANWLDIFGGHAHGGAMDYWAKMYKIGIGLEDLRFAEWMQHLFGWKERVPRWVAYIILPTGLALFAYRSLEAAIAIARGKRDMIIASHEAEDLVAENQAHIER